MEKLYVNNSIIFLVNINYGVAILQLIMFQILERSYYI